MTPRAGRDRIEGEWRDADGRSWLAVRLAAAPSDGAANEALIRLLMDQLSIRRGEVKLVSGASSRLKRLLLAGDAGLLAAKLTSIIGGRA